VRTGTGRRSWWPLALAAAGLLALPSCAKFDDRAAGQTYVPAPQLTPQAGPDPQLPEDGGGPGSGTPVPPQTSIPPPQGCTDFDKAVIETCLDTIAAVAALPNSSQPSALAAERRTGRLLQVAPQSDPIELAKLAVDPAGDGGLTGIALSPTYDEDQLIFAYVTTPTDNRVVRITKGQQPKPVLTGIPKGSAGNRGALMSDGKGALLVATGDAGDPSSAADQNSLAGKVLRIDTTGKPAPGNPIPSSPVFANGLHSPGGLCKTADGARLWVTDRAPDKDAIYKIQAGASLAVPAWTWPDRPGVSGCADGGNTVSVATSNASMQNLPITSDGGVGGKPSTTMNGSNGPSYGKLSGMDAIDTQYAFVGTVNKDGGKPVSSDDRVVVVQLQAVTGGTGKD
jgi:glucose/arabinose dehydrogenase